MDLGTNISVLHFLKLGLSTNQQKSRFWLLKICSDQRRPSKGDFFETKVAGEVQGENSDMNDDLWI